jgi:general secretion pathway protein I
LIKNSKASGFTLIELLVAFAIALLGVGAVLAAASGGLNSTETAARYARAVRQAQNRLASVGVERPLAAGQWSGRGDDGSTWQVMVAPLLSGVAAAGGSPQVPTLYRVMVVVAWPQGPVQRTVSLETLRLGPTVGND